MNANQQNANRLFVAPDGLENAQQSQSGECRMKCIAWLLPVFLVMTANLFAQDGKTTPLSDGKSFEGWEGNLKAFRIEEGAFVAGTLKGPNPRNEYLCTTKEYDNFELRLKCKAVRVDPSRVTGPLPAYSPNGGIQIRSERVPNSGEMIGYQADAGPTAWGDLYDERRHWMLVKVKPEELVKIVKKGQWNDYIIRCQGLHVQIWVNGHKTVDYTEPDKTIPQTGVIGLQIHVGPPGELWYKDITLKPLPAEK